MVNGVVNGSYGICSGNDVVVNLVNVKLMVVMVVG